MLPPNFTRDNLRTVHVGTELNDLYRTIAAGIGGANMPTWKGALKEDELWGLVYYVKSLMDLKGTPTGNELYSRLAAPSNMDWKPAPEPSPSPAPAKKK